MKKKVIITLASLAAAGAAVVGYLHFSRNGAFGHSYLKASAKQGNQFAQYTLGKLYLLGQEVQQDKEQAIEWLTRCGHRETRMLSIF